MTATNIDPFAPGDSPQHPSNWDRAACDRVSDALAALYQWRRDHFAAAAEAESDIPEEGLEDRHVRYGYLLAEYGAPEEQADGADFTPQPVLLRRSVWHDLEDVEIDEWKALFEQHSTDDERDPMWVDGAMPDLSELRARARVAEVSQQAPTPEATQEEAALDTPKATALKSEWVEYALAVEKRRGVELSEKDQAAINSMTMAELKAKYRKADGR